MRLTAWAAGLLLAAACAGLIAGCGGSGVHRHTRGTHKLHAGPQTLDIYSGLPLSGPSAAIGQSIVKGIRLALDQAGTPVGAFDVRYHSLNDARPGQGAWDAALTAANARKVATDAAAVTYIGDFDSGATEVSLPILNEAGIPQISPWSPYVGLTQSVPGITALGEPNRYYPASRTLLRIAPDDAVQAAAMLEASRAAGCTDVAVLRGGGAQGYGRELELLMDAQRLRYGLTVTTASLSSGRASLRRFLLGLRNPPTDCVAYVGTASLAVPPVLAAVHAALPRAPIVASDRLCSAAAQQSSLRSELAADTGDTLQCLLPGTPAGLQAGASFLSAWRQAYPRHADPGPWAVYGYAGMQLALATIAQLGSQADDRSRLLHALFLTRARDTVLGDYGFDAAGNVTLRAFGLYAVRAPGPLVLERVLQPAAAGALR